MVEFILCWSPEWTVERKLKLLSTTTPIVIDLRSKSLKIWFIYKLFIMLLQKGNNPAFASRNYIVLASPCFQLNYRPLQELLVHCLFLKVIVHLQSFQKEAIHLRKLIGVWLGQIKKLGKSDVIGGYFSKRPPLGYSSYDLYFGHHDLLLILLMSVLAVPFGLWEQYVRRFQCIKLLAITYKLERLGHVKFAPMTSHFINIMHTQITPYYPVPKKRKPDLNKNMSKRSTK